jgi:hypothetical protein
VEEVVFARGKDRELGDSTPDAGVERISDLYQELRSNLPPREMCHIYGRSSMKPESIRTTVDIPAPLYRRLKAQAAAQGCSARELILRGMERVVLNPRQPARQRVQFPLIRSQGPKVRLSNEQMYEHVEFP